MSVCRTCGRDDVTPLSGSRHPVFGICGRCGSLQNEGKFDRSRLSGMDLYGGTTTYPQFCMTLGQRIFRSFPLIRYMTPGMALQVEANDGYLASTWMHRGWVVDATSLSAISAARAERLGVRILGRMPSELSVLSGGAYDAVISEMGYSRFPFPFEELSRALLMLRVGGAVLIHGPNPAAAELLSGNHGHLSDLNLTIPHPNEIVRFGQRKSLVMVERREDGPDLAMVMIKLP